MSIRIREADIHLTNLRTRLPFRYGMATMTVVPHAFTRVVAEVDGKMCTGLAADHLPPKWFTKNADTSYRDDVADMLAAIDSAQRLACALPPAETVFDFWRALNDAQGRAFAGSDQRRFPPLLTNFGVSFVERALIAAYCKAMRCSFGDALRGNLLGIRLGQVHPVLAGRDPADLLPRQALREVTVRQTVGLDDPLDDRDIPAGKHLGDGLPQSLEASIGAYGLTHFKIKLSGNTSQDLERLTRAAAIIEHETSSGGRGRTSGGEGRGGFAITLDGNEQYPSVNALREAWETIARDPLLQPFLKHLIFLEQPLPRGVAISPEVGAAFTEWTRRPAIIIDESDDALDSLPRALDCGYCGTTYKSCKGVFKGIANACLVSYLNRQAEARGIARLLHPRPPGIQAPGGGEPYILSAEDLCNIGPVALLQDLAVAANLGLTHVERNGHHYFAGLSMFTRAIQDQVVAQHHDLYRHREFGGHPFAGLEIAAGHVSTDSVVQAPFGTGFDLDVSRFTPRAQWAFEAA
jgi:hypothetical protein